MKYLLILFLSTCLNSSAFTLVKQRNRTSTNVLTVELKKKIKQETGGLDEADIMKYSIELTASYLSFSSRNNITQHKANCVGYANLCSNICNYALKVNHMYGYAKPVVGYIKFNSLNLCDILVQIMPNRRLKLFVKDHDFVEFYFGNHIIYADPCAYDLINEYCMTFKE